MTFPTFRLRERLRRRSSDISAASLSFPSTSPCDLGMDGRKSWARTEINNRDKTALGTLAADGEDPRLCELYSAARKTAAKIPRKKSRHRAPPGSVTR